MGPLLADCAAFYEHFVTKNTSSLAAPQEIAQMAKFIDEEEARAQYYIHE